MPDCAAYSQRMGRLILFIGNEAWHWKIADIVKAAKEAQALGCDGICIKRADGTDKWYGSVEHLQQEYAAIMALGCTYIPFSYCYGPAFGESEIADECALLVEMQSACGGIAVANMEREWNGKLSSAQSFAKHMKALKAPGSLLIASTWADPYEQDWKQVTTALLSVVDVWWPEQYTNWLAAQEKELIDLGETCIAPTIDLSYPSDIDNYAVIAIEAKHRGHTTLSIWEYGDIKGKEAHIMGIAALMGAHTLPPAGITEGATPMTNAKGEVADFLDTTQFEDGESNFTCVARGAATCRYAGEPGKGPSGTAEQIDALADHWYAKLTGSVDAGNTQGMNTNQLLQIIVGMGYHYVELPINANSNGTQDIANIKGALLRGYPVIIQGAETGMHDMGLGGRVPYGWVPSGNHAIVATGIARGGNLLVRDYANVEGNTPRPGPRTYDAVKLNLFSGVVFVPSWLPRPPDAMDWTSAPDTAPIVAPPLVTVANVPQGWVNDADVLYSMGPGSFAHIPIMGALRQHILSAHPPWPPENYALMSEQHMGALEGSNPAMGAGIQQLFRFSALEMQDGKTTVIEVSVGQELAWTRAKLREAVTKLDNARRFIERLNAASTAVK